MMMAMTRVVGYCTSRALDLRRERLMADGGGAGATIILHRGCYSMIFRGMADHLGQQYLEEEYPSQRLMIILVKNT